MDRRSARREWPDREPASRTGSTGNSQEIAAAQAAGSYDPPGEQSAPTGAGEGSYSMLWSSQMAVQPISLLETPSATDYMNVRSLLSEEERQIQDTVARFVDERVLPIMN